MTEHQGDDGGYREVTIICDSDKHARGKVATIEKVCRVNGVWVARADLGRLGAPDPVNLSAVEEFRRPDNPAGPAWGSTRWRRIGSATGASRRKYQCKLCNETLEATEPQLAALLDAVVAEGRSRISIGLLNVIASRRT